MIKNCGNRLIFTYDDEHIMVISNRELEYDTGAFLWNCYNSFIHLFKPQNNDNLILIWESDFKKLLEKK